VVGAAVVGDALGDVLGAVGDTLGEVLGGMAGPWTLSKLISNSDASELEPVSAKIVRWSELAFVRY
jgi:hypothetical protein